MTKFAAFLLAALAFSTQGAPPPAPPEALTGFDPILVVAGKETLGKDELFSDFEGLRYLFATAGNKQTFDRDPSRYGIQLGRSCARMGAGVAANPDNYAVVNGRIYAFGSPVCRTTFLANPDLYLPAPDTVATPSAAESARAKALVKKAAAAAGGEALLARLTGWEESWTQAMGPNTANFVARSTMADSYSESAEGLMGTRQMKMARSVDGARAEATQNDSKRALHPGGRNALIESMHRHPMALLAAAERSGTTLMPLGPGTFAGHAVEFVRVGWAGTVADLAIAADGTLAGVRFKANLEPDGQFGTLERVIQARQIVSGLNWPTEYTEIRNGTPSQTPPLKISSVKLTLAGK